MSLQKTLNQKEGLIIPYEILLNVMDELTLEAEESQQQKVWWIKYDSEFPEKLLLIDDYNGPPQGSPQRARFRAIRLVSQINRQMRSMVHQKFRRFPLQERHTPSSVKAWVVSRIDAFIPYCSQSSVELTPEEHWFLQNLTLPTPKGHAIVACLERLYLPSTYYLTITNADAVRMVSTLPNLKQVSMNVGMFNHDILMTPGKRHCGIIPIDENIFPELSSWAILSPSFFHMWGPFQKRGIKLYGTLINPAEPMMELIITKEYIRIKFLEPDCPCCELAKTGKGNAM
ncbi:uncharacterized protein CTRU02_206199 [Colletotrichum truncatum]|uniref:Uncharacterized protein n=1 Tax=Colletotrichum truncatum TaxID=5467 RepID=A0ACC3Z672_COLTU|nr:uncharacterized protein CTRU02_10383 [Colletotrichum truncatum]KAF6787120.1 hypothetical protein CTRU02_10383 [Colletotrichum truncatum]